MTDKFLSREESAKYLGVTIGTIRVWASTKKDKLPFYKHNGKAQYKKEDLDAFITSSRVGGII